MNCLSHAWKYLDDPWFAAGTCLPDWLGMVDRKARMRRGRIDQFLQDGPADDWEQRLARGVLQHLADDEVFHSSPIFLQLSNEVSRMVSAAAPCDNSHRAPFVGHIVVELQLDAAIETESPGTLDKYYAALSSICPVRMEASVNRVATKPTDQLVRFMEKYLNSRFLFAYLDDSQLLQQVNRIMNRVGMDALPATLLPSLNASRKLVWENRRELLGINRH